MLEAREATKSTPDVSTKLVGALLEEARREVKDDERGTCVLVQASLPSPREPTVACHALFSLRTKKLSSGRNEVGEALPSAVHLPTRLP